jgi:hypothetical protein
MGGTFCDDNKIIFRYCYTTEAGYFCFGKRSFRPLLRSYGGLLFVATKSNQKALSPVLSATRIPSRFSLFGGSPTAHPCTAANARHPCLARFAACSSQPCRARQRLREISENRSLGHNRINMHYLAEMYLMIRSNIPFGQTEQRKKNPIK